MNTMGTPVRINLVSNARYGEEANEFPMQLMTTGHVKHEAGKTLITYTETDRDEESGITVSSEICLTVEGQKITMERKGAFSNTMVFAKGRRFEGIYVTPYGEMDMATYTHTVLCDVGEEKGTVRLKYQLDVQGGYASTNELCLEYFREGKIQ